MENLQEKIEKRAYELYMKRGTQQGQHLEDWIQAEQEIKKNTGSKVNKTKNKKK